MKELAQSYGADSLKCRVPYDHWGQLSWFLNIASVESGEPDPGNVEFLRQVATQIAFALIMSGPMKKLTGCATAGL